MSLVGRGSLAVFALLIWMLGCGPKVSDQPKSSTEATVPESASPASVPAPAPPKDTRPLIAAFGDSLSAGYGADPGKSYPDYLQKLVDSKGYKFQVYNAGVSGDTTADGVARMGGVLGLKPSIVILEFGGNDGLRGLPVSSTTSNLAQMITAFQGEGAKVILAGMTLPRNYGPDYIHQFEQMYVQLAKQYKLKRIPFLLVDVAGVPDLMQADSIHPTAAGNQRVAQTVYEYVEPFLKES